MSRPHRGSVLSVSFGADYHDMTLNAFLHNNNNTTKTQIRSTNKCSAKRFSFLQSFEFRINIQRWPAKQRRILLFSMRDFVCHTSPLSRFLALALRMTTWLAFHLLLPALYFAFFFCIISWIFITPRARVSRDFSQCCSGWRDHIFGCLFFDNHCRAREESKAEYEIRFIAEKPTEKRGCKNAMCFNGFSCYSWCSAWWKIIAVNCTSTRRAVLRECFLCKFVWKNFHVYVMEFRMPRSEDSLVRNIESMHLQDAGENRLWKYLSPGKGSKS